MSPISSFIPFVIVVVAPPPPITVVLLLLLLLLLLLFVFLLCFPVGQLILFFKLLGY